MDALDRQHAQRFDDELRKASEQILVAYDVLRDVPEKVAEPIKRRIAEVLATIGLDLQERYVYAEFPDLRPFELKRDEKHS